MKLAEYLGLDRKELEARIIMAQGRQNTNYAINLYACHPFFIKGYCTMTNGENTAFIPIKDFLSSRGYPRLYRLSVRFRGVWPTSFTIPWKSWA